MMEESCIEPSGAMLAVISVSSAQPEAKAHHEGCCRVLLLSPLLLLVLLRLQLLLRIPFEWGGITKAIRPYKAL